MPDVEGKHTMNVICAGGFKSSMQKIAPIFDSKFGLTLDICYGTPADTRALVTAGSGFDVAVVTEGSLNEAALENIDSESRFLIAKSPVGMGLRSGLSPHSVADLESFLELVRKLDTIGLSDPKAGTNLGNDIIASAERLGFGNEVRQRAVFIMGPGSVVSAAVGKGTPDAVITLQSEIINVEGVQFLGAIPEEMGLGTPFVAGRLIKSASLNAATLFLGFLKSEEARQCMISSGLTVF